MKRLTVKLGFVVYLSAVSMPSWGQVSVNCPCTGAGCTSSPRTINWTDNNAAGGSTKIKAVHMNEMAACINMVEQQQGIATSFTSDDTGTGVSITATPSWSKIYQGIASIYSGTAPNTVSSPSRGNKANATMLASYRSAIASAGGAPPPPPVCIPDGAACGTWGTARVLGCGNVNAVCGSNNTSGCLGASGCCSGNFFNSPINDGTCCDGLFGTVVCGTAPPPPPSCDPSSRPTDCNGCPPAVCCNGSWVCPVGDPQHGIGCEIPC